MAGTFYVDIVSPHGSVFQGEVARLRAPGTAGTFEVLHNHAPMIASFDLGPLYITTVGGDRISFATSGGFLEVLNNTVTVIAETAEPSSDIDVERARIAEEKALERLREAGDDEERRKAKHALERARLRMSIGSVGTRISS